MYGSDTASRLHVDSCMNSINRSPSHVQWKQPENQHACMDMDNLYGYGYFIWIWILLPCCSMDTTAWFTV